jgi:hypothetical protein
MYALKEQEIKKMKGCRVRWGNVQIEAHAAIHLQYSLMPSSITE